jgi:hypothetical protein
MTAETTQVSANDGAGRPHDALSRRLGLALVAILLVFYLGLQNGLWAPISDGDIYLAIARNIATGQGFTFNGLPVRAIPPGWPLFLAGMMRISPSFKFLNLVPMCLIVTAMFLYYRVLLRLTTPRRAFIVCLVTGALSHVFHRTFQFHSEGLFCVIVAGTLLLAVQANERRSIGRIALVAALCALIIFVRWAGVLLAPLVAGALLGGQLRPKWDRLWIGAAVAMIVLVGAFFSLRGSQDEAEESIRRSPAARSYAANKHPIVKRLLTIQHRVPRIGIWYTAFLSEPVRLGQSVNAIDILAGAAGFGLLGLLVYGMVPYPRRRQWILLGALLYSLGIASIWSTVTGRYFVPVAPFLLLGMWEGVDRLRKAGPSPIWSIASRTIMIAALIGAAVSNLSLYAVNVWLLHADDFYGAYYSGQPKELMAIAEVLNARSVKDGAIGRGNPRPRWATSSPSQGVLFDLRGLSFLINRTISSAPRGVYEREPTDKVFAWARETGVKYYIHNPPANPWRIWHFRAPWLQEWKTGKPVGETAPFYELYEVGENGFTKVPLPETVKIIDRVPGL